MGGGREGVRWEEGGREGGGREKVRRRSACSWTKQKLVTKLSGR